MPIAQIDSKILKKYVKYGFESSYILVNAGYLIFLIEFFVVITVGAAFAAKWNFFDCFALFDKIK